MKYWEKDNTFTMFKENDIKEACVFLLVSKKSTFLTGHMTSKIKAVLNFWHKSGLLNLTIFKSGVYAANISKDLQSLIHMVNNGGLRKAALNEVPKYVYSGFIISDCVELYSQTIIYNITRSLRYTNLGKKRE